MTIEGLCHVCLVSGQPIPNLMPLKMEEYKPKEVILLVSDDMKTEGDRLNNVIRTWRIPVKSLPIKPYDYESARESCRKLIEVDMILNITGGTKVMALAAYEVFSEAKLPVIYVDTQNKSILQLSPDKAKLNFRGVINLKSYLSVYGQAIVSDDTSHARGAKDRLPLLNALIQEINRFEYAISKLNSYTARHRDIVRFPHKIEIAPDDLRDQYFTELLALFERYRIFKRNKNIIEFCTAYHIKFASGDWLSEYVFNVVATTILPTDLMMGVKVKWDQRGKEPPQNDYDVVFTFNNKLYLIECKTMRFEGRDKEKEKNEIPIYKLENLRDTAGGLFGNGMLVSYKRLTADQKNRLSLNKLQYCENVDLRNLHQKIRDWVE